MRLEAWLRSAANRLTGAGRDAPRTAAETLAGEELGCDRLRLRLQPERPLPPDALARLEARLARRLAGEPLAYILGRREFYGRDFAVSPDTLIPRPETEHLIEAALARRPADGPIRFADMGTGTGCIAITLAAERPAWRGTAVDISGPALAVARANARAHGVADRLSFVRADMGRDVFAPGSLDLLVSNPPYVSLPEYETLAPELRYEPRHALIPSTLAPNSPSGLECLERLIFAAARCLAPGGWLCLEHGWTQAAALHLWLSCNKWEKVCTLNDLAGLNRITIARKAVARIAHCDL